MAQILTFKPRKTTGPRRGNILCRSGHHKWAVDKQSVFDVKLGKLVNRYRCTRCGQFKVRAD